MPDLRDLAALGEKLCAQLVQLAELLNIHHRNVKVAKLLGSASALVGGVVTVASAVAAVPTGGLTLPLAGAGMMISGAGGVVSAGASLAELIIEAYNVADMQREWDKFIKVVDKEYHIFKEASGIYPNKIKGNAFLFASGYKLANNSMNPLKGVGLTEAAERLSTGATQIGKAAKDGGLTKLAELGGSAIGNEVFFLNVALIPINLIDLVRAAADLRENRQSKACLALFMMAETARWIVEDKIKKDERFSSLPDYYKPLLE